MTIPLAWLSKAAFSTRRANMPRLMVSLGSTCKQRLLV